MGISINTNAAASLREVLNDDEFLRLERCLKSCSLAGMGTLCLRYRSIPYIDRQVICLEATAIVVENVACGKVDALSDLRKANPEWERPLCLYFHTTLKSLAVRFLNERRRRKEDVSFDAEPDRRQGKSVLDDLIQEEEQRMRLEWLDQQLRSGEYPYLSLCLEKEEKHLTHRQLADVKGMSVSSLKSHLQRVVQRLRKEAVKSGLLQSSPSHAKRM